MLPRAIMSPGFIALIILTTFLGGCLSHRSNEPAPDAPRFLALGDSYTIGESVEPARRWPAQLVAMLREQGLSIGEPEIIARTGWTTDELDAAIDEAGPEGEYALVSLLVGVNNQYRERSVANFRDEFTRLLERAIGFAGNDPARVIVLSIPDWGVTPFARLKGRDAKQVAHDIDEYNLAVREVAAERGVAFFDVTPISRRSDPSLLADDGLHPSAAMYRLWAELIAPHVIEVISRR